MENIVYITTNLTNGKKYIGSSNGKNPYYLGSGILLKKSIKIYGAQNFKREILWEGPKAYTREMEEYWIDYFNASKNPLFYNLSEAGVGNLLGNPTTLGKTWICKSERETRSDKGKSKPKVALSRIGKTKYGTQEARKEAHIQQQLDWNKANKEKIKEYNKIYNLKQKARNTN